MNIMYVKYMDMIALDVIQSLNLCTKSPHDCCGRKMFSFFLDVFSMDVKCFTFLVMTKNKGE
jgi:hypothetical protein